MRASVNLTGALVRASGTNARSRVLTTRYGRPMTDFLSLHVKGKPLLQPNAWDAGSARILAALGFAAIATTSSGFAATLGRRDGHITRDEALAHCRTLSTAVDIPVAADLENCFPARPVPHASRPPAPPGPGLRCRRPPRRRRGPRPPPRRPGAGGLLGRGLV